MLKWLKEMRGNAMWDAVKWFVRFVMPFILPVGYAILQAIRKQPLEWGTLVLFVIVALVYIAIVNRPEPRAVLTPKEQPDLQDRKKKAEAETMPQPVTVPTVAASLPQYSNRQFVDVTPEYLVGLFEQHTSIQAQRLIEPYIGKWMRLTGPLRDVGDYASGSQLTLTNHVGDAMVCMWFHQPDRRDRFSVLGRGTNLTVIGKIEWVHKTDISLDHCELENPKW